MKKKQTIFLLTVSLFLLGSVFVLLYNTAPGYAAEGSTVYLPLVSANYRPIPTPPPDAYDWPMAGANVERTSWVSEEIRGSLKPEWYTHFDAYISQKVQIVAAAGFLYISAADGLHALSADNGVEIWFYPTDLPLGHSPTYYNGVVYVGGMDKMIHAIDARTGDRLWTFEAEAGFHTNPLVVNGMLYAGNRDGYFYAIHTEGSQTGQLAWKYKTGAPILYSAAYKDGVVFFASNDMHAYALNAQTGSLVWKSVKLPGHGFHSFWPVVYRDYVVFSSSWNYRLVQPGPQGNHNIMEREDVYPANASPGDPVGPYGHEPGDWAEGTTTINASAITDYFEDKPYRRTYLVLNRFSGKEYTFDYDRDGKPEYAPILYYGAKGGTRYPPAVGADGVLYQANNYIYQDWIPRGQVSGWKLGTPFISVPTSLTNAVDEPLGYSIGGNVVYTRLCCDREASAFDLVTGDYWYYFDQGGDPLRRYLPDLFEQGWDFAYWKHGDPSAPVPYNGRVYTINNNAVVAFSPNGGDPVIPPNEDLGVNRGERASDVEKSTVVTGLNTKVTLDANSWPLLIQQERYYEQNYKTDVRTTYTRIFSVAGAGATAPSALSQDNTAITTRLVSSFGSGQTLQTWVSRRSPTVLLSNTSNAYYLQGTLVGAAYMSSTGVQIAPAGTTIPGSALAESWLLVWDDTDEHRWLPMVISLANRPGQIAVNSNGITLSYSSAAGYLGITPLYGMSAPFSDEATSWFGGIPSQTLERIRLLNRAARFFPADASETRSIDSASGDALISINYQYIQVSDAWNTPALRLAYLPTTLALAAWNGSPIRVNDQPLSSHVDFNYVTPLGRVAGVRDTSSVTVRLPGIANYWRNYQEPSVNIASNDPLLAKLVNETQEMVAAGHLRPGYGIHGIWDAVASARIGHYLADYYHNPAETTYTLLMALPLLPDDVRGPVRQYIQDEFQAYPAYSVTHMGWNSGTPRDDFSLPPEVEADAASFSSCDLCNSWGFPGENIYASYLYAREFGNATGIFAQVEGRLGNLPDYVQSFPNRLNSNIIGYIGYLRLADLAGTMPATEVEKKMVDLLIARAALSKYPSALAETGFEYGGYKWSVRTLATSYPDTLFTPRIIGTLWSQMPLYGFPIDNITGLSGGHTGGGYAFGIDYVNLVPELAAFMNAYSRQEVADAVDDYNTRAPYWFVAQAEELGGESVIVPIYDRLGLFQAKAMILGESRTELEKYLDVPVMQVGDLYYMLNLIAALKASP